MANPLILAAVGQPENLSIFDPASPPAESIRNLGVLSLAVTGLIFLVVEGIIIYSILRFRRKKADGTVEPPQVYGSKSIEIAWTAAPCLIVGVLILVTARTLWEVNVPLPEPQEGDNTLFVTVVGRQWWWEYRYDYYNGKKLGFTTANELHVPVSENGTPRRVYLKLESADVCHSFWVPRLAGKTDLIPGRTKIHMWFEAQQTGLFLGQCAEYCGTQHANMLLRVVVESPTEFDAWLKHESAARTDDPKLADDKKVFLTQSCVNCHAVRGTSATGTYGPDLTHLMYRKTLASGMIENDALGVNLTRWVDDPQKIKQGCLMPAFNLTGRDRDAVLRYLRSLD